MKSTFIILLVVFFGTVHPQQQNQQQQGSRLAPQQQQQQQQQANRPLVCQKLDFNHPNNPQFPGGDFITKEYKPGAFPTPFRANSRHYLSCNIKDFAFAKYDAKFSLTPTSFIETAVYFQGCGNSFFDIVIYDVNSNTREVLHINGTNGWTVLKKNILRNIPNARIQMNANNLTPQCVLAIEYLHILNSAIKTPECTSTPPLPPTTRPPPVVTTKIPQSIGPQKQPVNQENIWQWAITGASLGILFVSIILIGIYCIIDLRRKRAKDFEIK